MPVAVVIQIAPAPQLHPGLGIALGVELHQLDPVCGDEGREGDIVRLGHGMVHGQKMLIFHTLDGNGMAFFRLLRFQRRQCHAAAADHSIAYTVDHIAADGTDIELASQQIGRYIAVDDVLSIHQFDDGTAVKLTVTEYFRPSGETVNGVGITPDIEAEGEEVLEEALKELEQ